MLCGKDIQAQKAQKKVQLSAKTLAGACKTQASGVDSCAAERIHFPVRCTCLSDARNARPATITAGELTGRSSPQGYAQKLWITGTHERGLQFVGFCAVESSRNTYDRPCFRGVDASTCQHTLAIHLQTDFRSHLEGTQVGSRQPDSCHRDFGIRCGVRGHRVGCRTNAVLRYFGATRALSRWRLSAYFFPPGHVCPEGPCLVHLWSGHEPQKRRAQIQSHGR